MKILQIVESAYRATLEEQDDTVLWLSHAMKNAGAEITLLLRNNAVNYAVAPLKSGKLPEIDGLGIDHPPDFAEDLQKMMGKGINIYVWQSDLEKRGIRSSSLIEGIQLLEAD